MISPDLHNQQFDSVGTSGLVLFGSDQALSYTRDGNTPSYPHFVDLAGGAREVNESPYETFARELREEFALEVTPEQIVYAVSGPSLALPGRIGWFVVATLEVTAIPNIKFGNEGTNYQVTSIDILVNHERLIPRRKQQIQAYLKSLPSAHDRSK